MATEVVEEVASEEVVPKASGSKKLKIIILVALVMGAQIGAFYFFAMGDPKEVDASAVGETDSGEVVIDEEEEEEEKPNFDPDLKEIEIGTFTPTNRGASTGTLHVTFKLTAMVSTAKEQDLKDALDLHKARIEQAVGNVIRSSSLEDLDDSNLIVIKRLIKEEVNKVLRQSIVTEIVIGSFNLMEQ